MVLKKSKELEELEELREIAAYKIFINEMTDEEILEENENPKIDAGLLKYVRKYANKYNPYLAKGNVDWRKSG